MLVTGIQQFLFDLDLTVHPLLAEPPVLLERKRKRLRVLVLRAQPVGIGERRRIERQRRRHGLRSGAGETRPPRCAQKLVHPLALRMQEEGDEHNDGEGEQGDSTRHWRPLIIIGSDPALIAAV